jgi:hypothetical protein
MLEDFELDLPEDDEDPNDLPPEGGNNRTFMLVAGGLGAILVIAMIYFAVSYLRNASNPILDTSAVTKTAFVEKANKSLAETGTAEALIPPTFTETTAPTDTPVLTSTTVPETTTDIPNGATQDPRTATVEALLTNAALAQTQAVISTITPTATATEIGALPDTGFIDDIGAPALLGAAALLIMIIVSARKLRQGE